MDSQQFVQLVNSPISAGEVHYGIIDENGNLSMVGNNENFQLGDGTTTLSRIPVPIHFPSKVVSISCGWENTGAVTEDGKAYIWGAVVGNLGMGETHIRRPQLVDHLKDKFAVKIVISESGYGIIFRDGSVYLKMINVIDSISFSNMIKIDPGVIDIFIDVHAVYILTKDGKIYTSGIPLLPERSKYLTREKVKSVRIGFEVTNGESIFNPVLIPFKKRVKQIGIMSDYLNVLTTDGEIFKMNSYGEGGPNAVYMLDMMSTGPDPEGNKLHDLQTALEMSKPHRIPVPEKIASISINDVGVAAITKEGNLYRWGNNHHGQIVGKDTAILGGGTGKDVKVFFKPIHLNIGSRVKYVAVGVDFTIAVTEDGVINYWGINYLKLPAAIKPDWYISCSNPISIMSQTEWKDDPKKDTIDYVKIYTRTRTGDLFENPACYERQNLTDFMITHIFADWVSKPGETLDTSGYGGKPGGKRFYRTINGNFVDAESFYSLNDPSAREYILEPKILNQRVGNRKGTFGRGQHHGQLPGFTIFYLKVKTT